jgi:hypothetical protein
VAAPDQRNRTATKNWCLKVLSNLFLGNYFWICPKITHNGVIYAQVRALFSKKLRGCFSQKKFEQGWSGPEA